MICRQCGHANETGARFCSSCGAPLDGDETTGSFAAFGGEEGADAGAAAVADLPEGAAVLVVRRGPNAGSVFGLDRDEVRAGRHPESEIFLDDITVSRRHALVERSGAGWSLRDVGSLNGTYVNRERVDGATLRDGDEIQIGRFVLTYHIGTG